MQSLLHALEPFGQPILLARETAKSITACLTLLRSRRLRGDLTFLICELSCFELQIAKRAPAALSRAALQLALEFAQSVERTRAAFAGLAGVLPAKVVGGAAHLLLNLAHLLTARLLPALLLAALLLIALRAFAALRTSLRILAVAWPTLT